MDALGTIWVQSLGQESFDMQTEVAGMKQRDWTGFKVFCSADL